MIAIKTSVMLLLYLLLTSKTWKDKATAFDFVSISSFRQNPSLLVHYPVFRSGRNFLYFSRWQLTSLWLSKSDEEYRIKITEKDAKTNLWASRRKYIRTVLRFADAVKCYRISHGVFDDVDEDITAEERRNAERKSALVIAALIAAITAVGLRVGGRAALVSILGIDFASYNPDRKNQIDSFLSLLHDSGPFEPVLFILAWIVVKVFCFDAGGVVLAIASGFGGVLQGALLSAFAATIGSSVAFALAKLDTPIRQKTLELIDKNPSLRGVEKVVAKDGVKAVLILRLAPVLPLPIGAYNYVYGVTNVPFADFALGIFLGSIKPYILDSYLGIFGKSIVDGTSSGSSTEDAILILAMCASVMIGAFASQLAGETWESVQREIEAEKIADDQGLFGSADGQAEGTIKDILGLQLPNFIIEVQKSFRQAGEKVTKVVAEEYNARLWNHTQSNEQAHGHYDPATSADSPEVADEGFDIGQTIIEGFVFTPVLIGAFIEYADPLRDGTINASIVNSTKPAI